MRRLFTIIIATLSFACSGDDVGCEAASDCAAGEVCFGGECARICSVQGDCPDGYVCTPDDICVAAQQGGSLPVIESVAGNDPAASSRITDGLIVTGSHLDPAVFELASSSGAVPLTVRSRTANRAELVLPVDVRSGSYTLVATNLIGSDQEPVTLELPELDADTLLGRINDASGNLVVGIMPDADDLMAHLNTGDTDLALDLLPEHSHGPSGSVAFPLAYGMENLVVHVDPASPMTTVVANIGGIVVFNPTTTDDLLTLPVGDTFNATLSTNGAGGLDTGTEANSTWYYIWFIYNPSTEDEAIMLSTSVTYSGVTLPTGYTHLARLGAVRNSSAGNFVPFYQVGRTVTQQYIQVTAIAQGSEQTIDVSPFVPVNAVRAVYGWLEATPNQPGAYLAGEIYAKVGSTILGKQHITAAYIDGPGGSGPDYFETRSNFRISLPPHATLYGFIPSMQGSLTETMGVHVSGYELW